MTGQRSLFLQDRPTVLAMEQVAQALRSLGLEPELTMCATIAPDHIEVVEARLDEQGYRYAAGGELATITYRIAVKVTEET
jgi:hypothetical protein